MDVLTKITQQYSMMTASEKKIAEFVLHHIEETLTLNTRTLAEAAGVSSATVIRFIRTVGFETYAALRLAIAQSSQLHANLLPVVPESGFSLDYANLQLNNTIVHTVITTQAMQSGDMLKDAARLIHASNMLHLYGVGTSGIAAENFQTKMVYINQACIYYPNEILSAASNSHIGKGSVAMGISYSGRNKNVITLIENCRKNGVKTIAITQNNSPLSKLADYLLPIPYVDDGFCIGANLSFYAQMVVLDMLYLSILNLARIDMEKSLAQSKENIEKHIQVEGQQRLDRKKD